MWASRQYSLRSNNQLYSLLFGRRTVSPADSGFSPDFDFDFGSDFDSDSSSPLHLPSHHPSPPHPPQPLPPRVSFVSYPVQFGNDLLPSLLPFHLGKKVLCRRMIYRIWGILDLCGVCTCCSSIRGCGRRLRISSV
jgi:hypothetical protein